jgi:hypothetical protein
MAVLLGMMDASYGAVAPESNAGVRHVVQKAVRALFRVTLGYGCSARISRPSAR